jgi:hypothetical protein
MHTLFKCTIAVAAVAAAFVIAGPTASAQEVATATATAPQKKVATSATPDMIKEAIERSHARTEKLRTQSRAEQWGSEEPFTYNPTASMNELATFQ